MGARAAYSVAFSLRGIARQNALEVPDASWREGNIPGGRLGAGTGNFAARQAAIHPRAAAICLIDERILAGKYFTAEASGCAAMEDSSPKLGHKSVAILISGMQQSIRRLASVRVHRRQAVSRGMRGA